MSTSDETAVGTLSATPPRVRLDARRAGSGARLSAEALQKRRWSSSKARGVDGAAELLPAAAGTGFWVGAASVTGYDPLGPDIPSQRRGQLDQILCELEALQARILARRGGVPIPASELDALIAEVRSS